MTQSTESSDALTVAHSSNSTDDHDKRIIRVGEVDKGQKIVVETTTATTAEGGFVWDRRSITTLLGVVALCLTLTAGAFAFLCGSLALVTLPLWLPLVLLTMPLWLPLLLLTCPLWLSAIVLLGATAMFWSTLLFGTVLFFVWPEEWLPESNICTWVLERRKDAIAALIKLQVKIALYSAGVGPLADAALMISDHVDLVAIQKAAQELDLAEFADRVREMDLAQMQAALMKAIQSLLAGSGSL